MSTVNRYSRLAKNSIIFAVATFGSNVLRFIIVPFYTYYLSTAEYGVVDTITTTVSLIMPIMILAIQEAVLRFTLDPNSDSYSVIKTSFFVFIGGSIVFLLGYYPFSLISIFKGLWWLFYLLLLSNAFNNILLNYTRGSGQNVIFMLGGIINTAIMLVGNVLLLAVFHKGLNGYFISLILGYSVSSAFLLINIHPIDIIKRGTFDYKLLRLMIKYSAPLIPTAAMWWVMNVADKYAITFIIGVSFTGIYAISHKIPTVITMFYAIFQQAWQISAVEEIGSKDRSIFYANIYNLLFRALFTLTSIIILFIKPFISFVVETSYIDAWKYAPMLLIGSVFSSMAGFLGVNYVVSQKTVGALITSALGAVVNIVLNMVFIPIWGVQGAAIATFIGFYVVWIVRAMISTGGVKIEQDLLTIHLLLAAVIVQSIVLIIEFKYQLIIQCGLVLLVFWMNKGVIIKCFKRMMELLKKKHNKK